MILWECHATFVKMHELGAPVHTWIMMFFGSAQRSCEQETHKCRFITSIREYPPYWKFQLAYFPLGIYATSNFMWIISKFSRMIIESTEAFQIKTMNDSKSWMQIFLKVLNWKWADLDLKLRPAHFQSGTFKIFEFSFWNRS